MLPGGTLGYMRAMADRFLTDTCAIERLSDAVDAAGAPVNTWEPVTSGVKCRLITPGWQRGNVRMVGEQPHLGQEYRVVLPAGTAVGVQHRVTLDGNDSRWLVVGVVAGLTDEVTVTVNVQPEVP